MKKTVFLFSGEGTHSSDTGFRLLKNSPTWKPIEEILNIKLDLDINKIWQREIGKHRCPYSPLLTLVSQICLADIWRQWGFRPDVLVGHSTGEFAAAYEAGLYSLEDIIQLAYQLGKVAANLEGTMLHGRLSDSDISNLAINISSFNFSVENGKHITVSGFADEMEDFQQKYPNFVSMKLPHPWHHPDYRRFFGRLDQLESNRIGKNTFLSGVTTCFERQLKKDHWHEWLIKPIDFIQTMQTLNNTVGDSDIDFIEIGFHPVLENCLEIFNSYSYASSMFRGEHDVQWILFQRRKLDQDVFLAELKSVIGTYNSELDYDIPLAYQGFDSMKFTEFSILLQPFFPTLATQDFYRYKTINQLINRFGSLASINVTTNSYSERKSVVISGMSCRFPSSVETLPQFWDNLINRTDQVREESGRGRSQAGFLNDWVSRFDHQYFNISLAEARTMDPQQMLALELTEMLWKDAGVDPEILDKKRIGVYIGVWSQEYVGDRTSIYYPSGTNPSIIAARISYHYDLQGPSWVSNTACSSSLVAVHYAAKDIEAGRVDYAIVGGVNMLLDENFSTTMRNAGFLSEDDRCKTFDDRANGYVRAEGGGLVLLANRSLVDSYYAELVGSATNQNGGRSQVITAPHPEAQEELITGACLDAGIAPQEIAYIECHGTGTKIGDPVEISAIQNTVARNRKNICYIGSVKSNMGHLESAAGIAGLIKSVAALNRGTIPPNLHFQQPNSHIDFKSYPIQVVTEATEVDHTACMGISSFGFGGSNAHIIIKGADDTVRKEIRPLEIPFDRERAMPLASYITLIETEAVDVESAVALDSVTTVPDVRHMIQSLMFNVTGVEQIDPNVELLEQGLDSMSATDLLRHLEEAFDIEIEPDILFEYPLIDTFSEELERRIAGRGDNRIEASVTRNSIVKLVNELFYQLTGVETIDPNIEMPDQGLDSMSATELISQLEASLGIEIGPEILFEFPLLEQFVDELCVIIGGVPN